MVLAHVRTSEDFRSTIRYAARFRPRVDADVLPAEVVFSNLPDVSPDEVCELMEERAQLSSRVRKPCYHISLTLPQDDARGFDSSDWSELTEDFLGRMALDDRQAVAYLHTDAIYPDSEERPHVHLVANRVGKDGRCVDTSWDFYRAQTALRQAEMHLGLIRERSSWEVPRRRDSPGQVQRRRDAGLLVPPTVRSQFQVSIDQAIEHAGSLDGVADFLRGLGADVRVSEQGWSLKHEGVAIPGSKLGRAYSAPAIAERVAAVEIEAASVTVPTPEPELAADVSVRAEMLTADSGLADAIANYAFSRSAVEGAPRSGTYQGVMGRLDFDLDPPDIMVAIEGKHGTKFEATRQGDRSWQILTDELDDSERQTILGLPQTPEGCAKWARGSEVVNSLLVLAESAFTRSDGGKVGWQDQATEFEFEILPQDDGSRLVAGSIAGEPVFRAELSETIRVHQADIPAHSVERLSEKAEAERQKRRRQQQRQRQRSRSRNDEIEL